MRLLMILPGLAVHFGFCARSASRYAAGLAVLGIALAPGLANAGDTQSLESAVKAAYLSKFGLYVEWPKMAFSLPSTPLNLCVAGEDLFGAALDKMAADQRISGRTVVVRRLKTVEGNSGCHILYIGGTDTRRARQMIAAIHGSSVLTVSDTPDPSGGGAIINFVIKDNRVRFDIDEEAAVQHGLSISSKLLNIALNVKRRHSEGNR